MRMTVAVGMAVSVLFVGIIAMSEAAQQAKPQLNSSAANATYNTSVGVFTGVGQAGGEGVVWFGVAAIIVGALVLLVVAGSGGRR